MVYLNLQNVEFLLKGFCILRSVTRIMVIKRVIAFVTGTCIFGDAAFLGSALGYLIAMCSPGWENLVAFDWNDLPVGREVEGKFLKNVKSPPHALPPPRRLYIDRCIKATIRYRSI